MLSDFILIEAYYDGPEAARAYEDLVQEYGIDPVRKAVKAGHIVSQRFQCSIVNKPLFWLTAKGRKIAKTSLQL